MVLLLGHYVLEVILLAIMLSNLEIQDDDPIDLRRLVSSSRLVLRSLIGRAHTIDMPTHGAALSSVRMPDALTHGAVLSSVRVPRGNHQSRSPARRGEPMVVSGAWFSTSGDNQ